MPIASSPNLLTLGAVLLGSEAAPFLCRGFLAHPRLTVIFLAHARGVKPLHKTPTAANPLRARRVPLRGIPSPSRPQRPHEGIASPSSRRSYSAAPPTRQGALTLSVRLTPALAGRCLGHRLAGAFRPTPRRAKNRSPRGATGEGGHVGDTCGCGAFRAALRRVAIV